MEGFEELTLELTDWCPSKCLHCSSSSGPRCNNFIDEEVALRLIDESASLSAKKISFGGGEPTLAPCFIPTLERTTQMGLIAEIFTCGLRKENGHLESISDDIINKCSNYPGVKLIFSLYGANAAVHDYITQTPDSFALLCESLGKCLDSRIECEVNFVPLKINFLEFEAIVNLVETLGINRLSVLRFVSQGRGYEYKEKLGLTKQQEDDFIETLLNLRIKRNIDIRTGSPFNSIIPGNKVPCRAGSGKLVVQASGNVLPCEVFKHHTRRNWGLSVYKLTLREVLTSTCLISLRRSLESSNCLVCPIHKILRIQEKSGGIYEKVSEATLQTK